MSEGKRTLKQDYINSSLAQGRYLSQPSPGEEIVISGIAATLPASEDVHQFMENLFNKVDMTQRHRWDMDRPDLPPRCGIIPDIDKLDLAFFGWHVSRETMDPSVRVLAERVIEAIFDAGLHPSDLEHTNTGMFIASCAQENNSSIGSGEPKGDFIMEYGRAPAFSTLSHYLKLSGRNFVIDTACNSSLCALEHAFRSLRFGEVDAAIVTGTQLLRHPHLSLMFYKMGVLSPDSTCKVFDAAANGYVRSEGVGAILLQKKRDAKRIYAEIIHVKSNCDGFKEDGITFPSRKMQKELLQEFYRECQIDPSLLSFMETHGTATRVGDPEECASIDEFFTKGREDSLLIGSVKSNMGHSETTAGIASIIKCIIAMETGFIPPNIHYLQPKQELKGIIEGRMTVVTNKTPFKDNNGLMGLNSLGFGGSNCHVLLKRNFKEKNANGGVPEDELPRLVCVSGRTRKAVDCLLNAIILDFDHIRLIHNIFRKNIQSHVYRGYIVLDKSGEIERYTESYYTYPKELYLIFGELNDTFEITTQFMQFKVFVKAFQKIQEHLLSSGIKEHLENHNDSILYKLAVQLAISDTLRILKINTVEVVGYSYGTLTAAYFNKVITLEEVFSCAVLFDNIISSDSKNTRNKLLLSLSRILPNRGLSAEYFYDSVFNKSDIDCHTFKIHSLLLKIGNVSLSHINEDLDIQSVFSNQSQNHVQKLLIMLGKLYCKGQNPHIAELYFQGEFPVARGTKMISPYVKWNHNRELFTLDFTNKTITSYSKAKVGTFRISSNGDWSFVTGHIVNGRNLFPETGYLRLVWELFISQQDTNSDDLKIVFEDCKFLRVTTVPVEGELKLRIAISRQGNFEVMEDKSLVVTGRIMVDTSENCHKISSAISNSLELKSGDIYKELRLRGYDYRNGFQAIEQCDIYATEALIKWEDNWVTFLDNMLQMKILQTDTRSLYVPTYLLKLSIAVTRHNEWIADNYKGGNQILLPVFANPVSNDISCGYIRINGLIGSPICITKESGNPLLEKYQFISNCTDLELTEALRVNSQIIFENTTQRDIKCIELIDESTVKTCVPLSPIIKDVFEDQPLVNPTITIFSNMSLNVSIPVVNHNISNATNCTLIIVSNVLKRKAILDQAITSLQDNGFIISRETVDSTESDVNDSRVTVVTDYKNSSERIIMLKKKSKKSSEVFAIQISSEDNFVWIDKVKDVIRSKKHDNVILYSENEPTSGILGLVNCLRKEPESSYIRCVFIMDRIERFNPKAPFFQQQLDKNLTVNVYKDGSWGTYRHMLLDQNLLTESKHCEMKSLVPGDIFNLKWVEAPLQITSDLQSEKVVVHVKYCALNYEDIMLVSRKNRSRIIFGDRLLQDDAIGSEYSGEDISGRRIAGINVPALSTMIVADKNLCFDVPTDMTLEEAVTIPVSYGTALYGLIMRARLKRGCSVLIHSAAGGIGQAAIRIALSYECEIFVTVDTAEKRQFIKSEFPKIKDCRIGNSRDTTFEQMIHRETNGRGVDVVLNSLAEDKLLSSVKCLAKGGKYLVIGQLDLMLNNELNLLTLRRGISFHGVMLDRVFNDIPAMKQVMKMIEDGIRCRIMKPLNTTVFERNEVEEAFRYMMNGNHMGKVLIKIKPENKYPSSELTIKNICLARYQCNPEKSYVIVGGLGGFGLELVDWLIMRGARKLVLGSRNGVTTGYQKYRLKIWSSHGVIIRILQNDIFTEKGCEALLTESELLGPVEAIFNLAAVLADSIFENQSIESFRTAFNPKAVATKHLDKVSRVLCPLLRDFVTFSSMTCGRGNVGQTNYGMANSIMERICELRRKDGFPAVAIQWGAIGEVGLIAEMQAKNKILKIEGYLQQKISNCLNALDVLLRQRDSAIVSSIVVAETRKGGSKATNVVKAVMSVMGINGLSSVAHHVTLPKLGMDSLKVVEIKQMLERDFAIFLTSKGIKRLTIARLKEIEKYRSKFDGTKGNVFEYSIFRKFSEMINRDITITKLPSLIEKDDSNVDTIFVFPGFEGSPIPLNGIAKDIKAHIYCFEYTSDTVGTSLDELVKVVKSLIMDKMNSKSFNFVAHSFGGIVALELAKKLESEGYFGRLFLIDTSPSILKKLIAAIEQKFGADLQTAVLCEILQIYYPAEEVLTLKDILQNSSASKLDEFNEILSQKLTFKSDLIQCLAKGVIQKTEISQSYQPSFDNLGAELTLIRGGEMEAIDNRLDYGLGEISQMPVKVHMVQSNHSSILETNEIIQLLNGWIQHVDN